MCWMCAQPGASVRASRPVGSAETGFEPEAPACKARTPAGSPWLSCWGAVCLGSCRWTARTVSLAGPDNPSRTLRGQEVGQTQGSPGPVSQDQEASLSQPRLTCQLRAGALNVGGLGLWCFTLRPHLPPQLHAPVKPRTLILTGTPTGLGNNLSFIKYVSELASHPH